MMICEKIDVALAQDMWERGDGGNEDKPQFDIFVQVKGTGLGNVFNGVALGGKGGIRTGHALSFHEIERLVNDPSVVFIRQLTKPDLL